MLNTDLVTLSDTTVAATASNRRFCFECQSCIQQEDRQTCTGLTKKSLRFVHWAYSVNTLTKQTFLWLLLIQHSYQHHRHYNWSRNKRNSAAKYSSHILIRSWSDNAQKICTDDNTTADKGCHRARCLCFTIIYIKSHFAQAFTSARTEFKQCHMITELESKKQVSDEEQENYDDDDNANNFCIWRLQIQVVCIFLVLLRQWRQITCFVIERCWHKDINKSRKKCR